MKRQFGRSMIEMLGVLAIIGVLSIGGIVMYRRAVNNHQANTILDDVNRFAFVILERSGLALGDVVSKGDFVESGIYTLEGYQDIEPEQFSITVSDVPRGVCEALLPKAAVEYAVRVKEHGSDSGILYDLFHTDLCNGSNDVVFYFGDTDDLFDFPDCGRLPNCKKYSSDCKCIECENGLEPSSNGEWCISGSCKKTNVTGCNTNEDCCDPNDFCAFEHPTDCSDDDDGRGTGMCRSLSRYRLNEDISVKIINGEKWIRSGTTNWWTADNWCRRQKREDGSPMVLASTDDLGCGHVWAGNCCTQSATDAPHGSGTQGTAYVGSTLYLLQTTTSGWPNSYNWLSDSRDSCTMLGVNFNTSTIFAAGINNPNPRAICR